MADPDDGPEEQKDYREWDVSLSLIEKQLGSLRPGEKFHAAVDPKTGRLEITKERPMTAGGIMYRHFAAIMGVVFVLVAIILAFSFNNPNPLQTRIILAVLSLGGGAFGSEISGMIKVDLSLGERVAIGATGAAAIFVVLYFFVPAS